MENIIAASVATGDKIVIVVIIAVVAAVVGFIFLRKKPK